MTAIKKTIKRPTYSSKPYIKNRLIKEAKLKKKRKAWKKECNIKKYRKRELKNIRENAHLGLLNNIHNLKKSQGKKIV